MAEPLLVGPRRATRPQRLFIGLGVLGSIGLSVVGIASIPPNADLVTALDYLAAIVTAVSLVLSGAVLAARLPWHPVGWILWVSGALFAVANGAQGLAVLGRGDPVLAGWMLLIGDAVWVPAIIGVTILLPLVFPTGRLPSPRWRILVVVAIGAIAFNIVQNALVPFDPASTPAGVVNPIGGSGAAVDLGTVLGAISSGSGVICLPLVAASLVLRFRRSSGVERAQLKWLALAIAIAGPAFALGILVQAAPGDLAAAISDGFYLLAFVGLALLPVAIGVAILRYRLYDIDVIIRRTAVYVPLTAILAGLYAGLTALLQRAFIAATGQTSDAAVVASTLVLATLFTPVRTWLQGVVDRRFRDDGDAVRELERFVARIAVAEFEPDPARTLRAFLAVALDAFEATGGRAALFDDAGADHTVASAGALRSAGALPSAGTPGTADLRTIVATAERTIGLIEIGPRRGGRTRRSGDQDLLDAVSRDLARAIIDGTRPASPAEAAVADVPATSRARKTPPLDMTPDGKVAST